MLCIVVELLTGYFVATHPNSRSEPEWPPHPARLFMAMVAAHFETVGTPAEDEALRFVESLEAPSVIASDAEERHPVVHYVPPNDDFSKDERNPLARSRQERYFPRVRPRDPLVYFIWPKAEPTESVRVALTGLCAKVTRIGHSSSLVAARLECPPSLAGAELRSWEPNTNAPVRFLRCPAPGLLDELKRLYRADDQLNYDRLGAAATGKSKAATAAKKEISMQYPAGRPDPLRPQIDATHGYTPSHHKAAIAHSDWSCELFAFRLDPQGDALRWMDISATESLVAGFRRALMAVAGENGPIPEFISGHKGSTSLPSEGPHCVMFPMPFVGHPHAEGRILGIAIAAPRQCTVADRALLQRMLGKLVDGPGLRLGNLGVWTIAPYRDFPSIQAIQPYRWTAAPAGRQCWASVTPISFDSHPKTKDPDGEYLEIATMIADACRRIGLPHPTQVKISHVSVIAAGVPTAYEFPRLKRKDGSLRRQLHAAIEFPAQVVGPLILGAGRYRGYGLMLPQKDVVDHG